MKNKEYWRKRIEILEKAQLKKGEAYIADLEKQYRNVSKEIEREITNWYSRFATENKITMAEAKKLLNSRELAEFRWDVKDYIKYGQENALNQQWMKELENASIRVHVSRLEALQLQMQQQIEVLYDNQLDGIDTLLRNIYSEDYYHTAYEIQKGFNVGWDLHRFDANQLNNVISKPWSLDRKTFSDRLWTNKQQLLGSLQTHLTQTIVLGQAPDRAIKSIADEFRVSKKQAGRLVMTESAAFSSLGRKDCFRDLEVEQYEIVATLDMKTSAICQELDGKVFDMKDYQVGITANPFHPWCRTTTAPFFEDDYSERAARGEDGETYYVPSEMKYKEWKKTFVDGGSKENLKKISTIRKPEHTKAFLELEEQCKFDNVEYNEVKKLNKELSYEEIVGKIAGGDMTIGSCSSTAFAYIANKNGLDVRDFRGGRSTEIFATVGNIKKVMEFPGIKGNIATVKVELNGAIEALKNLELNKEYYFMAGRHVSIVRRLENDFQYLELQSNKENGWVSVREEYGGYVSRMLVNRFKCRATVDKRYGMLWEKNIITMEVDSFKDNTEFQEILGYLNTEVGREGKGVAGYIK